jgi:hypothetical protein
MTRTLIVGVLTLLLAAPMTARGQQPIAATPKPALVPLDVDLVIARYQGDKKISSIPYTLNVNANGDATTFNMGTEVPVPTTILSPTGSSGQQPAPIRSYNYRNVGINVSLRASTVNDGLFQVQVNLEDSSVFSPDARQPSMPMITDAPAFRSFKGVNTVLLKDGQTRQYTVATDRVTGEVLKVDVTLKVLK